MSPIITPGGSGGGGSQPVQVATATLTDAQIKALPTTPIQIVAAPGASSIIVPLHATLRLAWTADYTGIDGTAQLFFGSASLNASAVLDETVFSGVSSLLAAGGHSVQWLPALGATTPGANPQGFASQGPGVDTGVTNAAISLVAVNALNFTGGNAANALKATLLYYTATV